jgi:hypothetical protein
MSHTVHDPATILARIKAEATLAAQCQANAAKQITFASLRDLRDRNVVILLNDGRRIWGRVVLASSNLAAIDLRPSIHHPQGGRLRLTPADVASIDLA